MSHPPAEFPFWVILSVCTAPPWVAHSNKSSHRHAICCGIVGLALALGGFLISLQHFFHTPNSFQLPLKTTLHATHPHMCISTLVPEGALCTIGMSVLSPVSGLHPIHTMCTVPIHEVPTYAHWPSSHPSMVGAPLCAHHTPCPSTFYNFPTPRCCHACSKSSHIATFGHSCPPCHPHPGVTPLQHWPQRPFFWEAGTLIGGPPPLSSYPQQCFACAHMPTSISSQIMPHLDPPIHPCHSSTSG